MGLYIDANDTKKFIDDLDVHMGNRCHFQNVGDSYKHICIVVSIQSRDEEATVSLEDREFQGMVQIREASLIGDNSNQGRRYVEDLGGL